MTLFYDTEAALKKIKEQEKDGIKHFSVIADHDKLETAMDVWESKDTGEHFLSIDISNKNCHGSFNVKLEPEHWAVLTEVLLKKLNKFKNVLDGLK